MPGVVLTLKAPPPWPVDLSPLLPTALAGQDAGMIARIPLGRLAVGDLFDVRAGETAELTIAGGSPLFEGIGAGMKEGALLVEGDAGAFAAAGLRGGRVEIRGDAGAYLGGVPAGGRIGMAGGVVVVRGAAGTHAGDRMRRGTLVVEGAAGPYAASRMIAGTLVVCGAVGASPGVLMRRGTLLLGTPSDHLPSGFVAAGLAADGVFLRLLARALRPLSARAAACAEAVQRRVVGDLASLGKGEILLAAAGAKAAA
jgi:formylmethanofuran dehydrogenase subunit C